MTALLQDLRYGLRLRAQAWYRSPEDALALEVRDEALSRNLILAEGDIPQVRHNNGKAFSLKMQAEIQTKVRTK
jgi:hypothetical protein